MKNVHKHIQGCNLKKVKNCLDRGVHLKFELSINIVNRHPDPGRQYRDLVNPSGKVSIICGKDGRKVFLRHADKDR